DVRRKNADHYAVDEPLDKVLTDRYFSTIHNREDCHRTPFHLLLEFRRLHTFRSARAGDHIIAGWDVEFPERVHDAVFGLYFSIVAFVITKHHVNDGAGDEHKHRRQQNWKPQSCELNHWYLLRPELA